MSNQLPESTPDAPAPSFIYVICQNGAESAAKLEIMTAHSNLKLAFSRPGFITFKVDADDPLPQRFTLRSSLARTYGWSIGKIDGQNAEELAAKVVADPQFKTARCVHVWQRDPTIPGKNGFEPGISALSAEIGKLIQQTEIAKQLEIPINTESKPDALVFDVVLVEPNQWWYGYHYANSVAGRWPGGVPIFDTTVETYSRAYFKLKEALLWSGINIRPGDVCAEIGSAPGGASQLLLELGANVIGIDPAEMEQEVLDNKKFTHIRRRGSEVKKRDFRDCRWLMADMNIDPASTVDTIAEIVQHSAVDVKGVILTMKLTDWKSVKDIPGLMARVKGLGFQVVKARQMAFNRQEFCLVAVKDKFVLRLGKKGPVNPKSKT